MALRALRRRALETVNLRAGVARPRLARTPTQRLMRAAGLREPAMRRQRAAVRTPLDRGPDRGLARSRILAPPSLPTWRRWARTFQGRPEFASCPDFHAEVPQPFFRAVEPTTTFASNGQPRPDGRFRRSTQGELANAAFSASSMLPPVHLLSSEWFPTATRRIVPSTVIGVELEVLCGGVRIDDVRRFNPACRQAFRA